MAVGNLRSSWTLCPAETAVKAAKVLDLESRQDELSKRDLLLFLYAVGMVSHTYGRAVPGMRCKLYSPQNACIPEAKGSSLHTPRRPQLGDRAICAAMQACDRSKHLPSFFPQNPTEDLVESKLRELKLHKQYHFTFGHFAHIW